jgi:hypothetical protein
MYKDLKTLHPGEIRTWNLLFWRQTRWLTTMPSRQGTGKTYFGQNCIRNFTSVTLYGYKTTWITYNIFFHITQINLYRFFGYILSKIWGWKFTSENFSAGMEFCKIDPRSDFSIFSFVEFSTSTRLHSGNRRAHSSHTGSCCSVSLLSVYNLKFIN